MARTVGVPAITNPATYSFSSPNSGTEAVARARGGDQDLVAPSGRSPAPGVRQFHGAERRWARSTRSRRWRPISRRSRIRTTASRRRCAPSPGAMNKQIGTKVFWVQTGGFDTHSGQGANAGAYVNLMATVNDSLRAVLSGPEQSGTARARRLSSCSRSSAGASARTAAPAPITAPPAS